MTVTLDEPSTAAVHNPRRMLTRDQWSRLAGRIVTYHPEITPELADRVLSQTLTFLTLVIREPDVHYAASTPVEIGWHTFILDTVAYTQFCYRFAGRYIHHVPNYGQRRPEPGGTQRTVASLQLHGLPVDEDLWPVTAEEHSPECEDCGCTNTGQPPTPPK